MKGKIMNVTFTGVEFVKSRVTDYTNNIQPQQSLDEDLAKIREESKGKRNVNIFTDVTNYRGNDKVTLEKVTEDIYVANGKEGRFLNNLEQSIKGSKNIEFVGSIRSELMDLLKDARKAATYRCR